MDIYKLKELLQKSEGQKLDFKRKFYEINHEDKRVQKRHWDELIKDILALGNGNVSTALKNGYLIIGVSDHRNPDGTRDLFDVGELPDIDNRILSKVNSACEPPFEDIHLDYFSQDEKRILTIKIPPHPKNLYQTTRQLETASGRKYPESTTFIRRGENIEIAKLSEIEGILVAKKKHADVSAPHFLVPFPRNNDFVGREEELENLHQSPLLH